MRTSGHVVFACAPRTALSLSPSPGALEITYYFSVWYNACLLLVGLRYDTSRCVHELIFYSLQSSISHCTDRCLKAFGEWKSLPAPLRDLTTPEPLHTSSHIKNFNFPRRFSLLTRAAVLLRTEVEYHRIVCAVFETTYGLYCRIV